MAGRCSAGATCSLLGASAADLFNEQRVYSPVRIIARNTRESAVDDQSNAVDGDGSLGDIGSYHYFRLFVSCNCGVLIARRKLTVQRKENVTARFRFSTDRIHCPMYLISTMHEHQDIAGVGPGVSRECVCCQIPHGRRTASQSAG